MGMNPKVRPNDQIAAIKELYDRGHGKAIDIQAQFILDGSAGGETAELVRGALDVLARALGGNQPVEALPIGDIVDGEVVPQNAAPSAVPSAVVVPDPDPKAT